MNKIYQCPEKTFYSPLKSYLTEYVEYKVNAGGNKPDSYMPKLKLFDKHCISLQSIPECLKRESIMAFLKLKNGESKRNLYSRITILSGFLEYMVYFYDISEIYLPEQMVRFEKTYIPYVFNQKEISSILNAARKYQEENRPPRAPYLPVSMTCIIAVLYCTGMRISEVLDLRQEDVDMEQFIIRINWLITSSRAYRY